MVGRAFPAGEGRQGSVCLFLVPPEWCGTGAEPLCLSEDPVRLGWEQWKGFCRPCRGWVPFSGTKPSADALGYCLAALRAWCHGFPAAGVESEGGNGEGRR